MQSTNDSPFTRKKKCDNHPGITWGTIKDIQRHKGVKWSKNRQTNRKSWVSFSISSRRWWKKIIKAHGSSWAFVVFPHTKSFLWRHWKWPGSVSTSLSVQARPQTVRNNKNYHYDAVVLLSLLFFATSQIRSQHKLGSQIPIDLIFFKSSLTDRTTTWRFLNSFKHKRMPSFVHFIVFK